LLNIVFGIILDTFAALRDLKADKEENMDNYCFICSLHRDVLERLDGGFEYHCKNEHNKWEYLYFIIYIKIKDKMQFSGTEQIIAKMIHDNDTSFFPLQRAMSLDERGIKEKQEMTGLKKKIEKLQESFEQMQAITKKIDHVEELLNEIAKSLPSTTNRPKTAFGHFKTSKNVKEHIDTL